jgi:hypothetical protein
MSATPWTPGPWGLQRPIGSSYGILLPDGSGYIGEVYTWEENGAEEAKANALLIQHVPEMAEALADLVRFVEHLGFTADVGSVGIARALLARIRGDAP